MTKFRCANCNKTYENIMGALICPCIKKVKWGNKIGRGRNQYEKFMNIIKGRLTLT